MTEDRKPLPPYLPYRTFLTFLDHLRAIGMPSHIDKSVMASLSGAMQSWLKSSLRYMQVVGPDDVPSPRLAKLATAQGDDRKVLLGELFKSSYAFLNGNIDLKNTTPQKLRTAIVDLGAQGETVEKIMAFMIAMAKDANIPLSTLLTKRAPNVRKPRAKSTTRTTDPERDDEDGDAGHDRAPETSMKTIALPMSGGTLTLSGNINLFNLIGKERALVFTLIDAMTAYEAEQGGGGD